MFYDPFLLGRNLLVIVRTRRYPLAAALKYSKAFGLPREFRDDLQTARADADDGDVLATIIRAAIPARSVTRSSLESLMPVKFWNIRPVQLPDATDHRIMDNALGAVVGESEIDFP